MRALPSDPFSVLSISAIGLNLKQVHSFRKLRSRALFFSRGAAATAIGLNLVQVHYFRKRRSRALGKAPYAGTFRSSAKCRPTPDHAVHGAIHVQYSDLLLPWRHGALAPALRRFADSGSIGVVISAPVLVVPIGVS
jgi:hypothetical protein